MPNCKNCGVELEETMEICPLCKLPPHKKELIEENKIIEKSIEQIRDEKKRKQIIWELLSLTFISGIIITLIINLVSSKTLSWSLISVSSISFTWILVTLFFFLIKRPFYLTLLLLVSLSGYLIIIDLLTEPLNWSLIFGLPISISLIVIFSLVVFAIKLAKQKGFNVLSILLLGVSAYSICVELSLNFSRSHTPLLSWSIIVAASILPICIILVFFHYRMKKGTDLKKYFHF
ncbi:DUF6320 domain-containing protein [Bacteroidota bacterium]